MLRGSILISARSRLAVADILIEGAGDESL